MKLPAATYLLPFFLPFEVAAQEPTTAPSVSKVPTAVVLMDSDASSDAPSDVPSSQPVVTAVPTPIPECISNSTYLRERMSNKDPFVLEEYIICPNTIVDVGFTPGGICCVDGDSPIFVRSNTHIKCGEDGSSKNNCVFRNGQYQMISNVALSLFEPIENFKVQGLTFEAGGGASIVLSVNGDVTFDDVIIKDHEHVGAVITFGWPELRRRTLQSELESMTFDERIAYASRHLDAWKAGEPSIFEEEYVIDHPLMEPGDEYAEEISRTSGRQLQTPTRMAVTFKNCTFIGNVQGPRGGAATANPGVVSSRGTKADFVFEKCLFKGNVFDERPIGYAIDITRDNDLTIIDSCFVDNNFFGNGTVLFNSTGEARLMNNYGTQDADLFCQFFADETNAIACTDYDADVCALDPMMPPTTSPTMTPSDPSGASKFRFMTSSPVFAIGVILGVLELVL